MAVHLPLSAEAQGEARILMLSAHNMLSPAHGRPLTVPSQDMVIGVYYLTEETANGEAAADGQPRRYARLHEVERAYEAGALPLHAPIEIRTAEVDDDGKPQYRATTAGRLLFENALPGDYCARFGYVTQAVRKRHVGEIVEKLVDNYPKAVVAESLDRLKDLGFRFASQSGLTISMDDVKTPPDKGTILDRYEKEAEKIENQFRRGIITDDERRQKEVEIWTNATEEVRRAMEKTLGPIVLNPIDMMVGSGARGNTMHVRQVAGLMVGDADMDKLRDNPEVARVRVRSVLTCEAAHGVCAACYGRSLATGRMIELGEAVGVIAAQSIGEPGTQLTMRTFHTGGIAGEDITHGLPRVVELFEARTPKGKAILSRTSGIVRISEDETKGRVVTVVGDDGEEESYPVSSRIQLEVRDGDEVRAGDSLVEGPKDPKELLEIKGIRETQQYLVEEVQKVYRDQGVSIHDKHIELIVRQMLRRVSVAEPGDSGFLPGERVDSRQYAEINRELVQEGNTPAEGRPELMGITKASLATDSWLSAASFQETTRVLTEAAIEGKSDQLLGLKENIIIGKLIPAGTGMTRYRNLDLEAPDYEPLSYYSSDTDQDLAAWLANIGTGDGDGDAAASIGEDEASFFAGPEETAG